jgi:hypothetical protein
MSRYDVVQKTERDAKSQIIKSGARWAETRPGLEQFFLVAFTASGFAVLFGLLWAWLGSQMNPLLGYGLVGLIGSACLIRYVPGEARAVYFKADGKMETPSGIYYRPDVTVLGGHHRTIVSIEARLQRDQPKVEGGWNPMYEVIMLSSGGDLICVSRNVLEWVAIKAAAQLTQSLNTVRREQADTAMNGHDAWAVIN